MNNKPYHILQYDNQKKLSNENLYLIYEQLKQKSLITEKINYLLCTFFNESILLKTKKKQNIILCSCQFRVKPY